MSLVFRLLLIAASVLFVIFVMLSIRKSKMLMEDSIFWLALSFILVLLGIFPGIAIWLAALLSIQSATNLVFLVIIALLLLRVFCLNKRISNLEQKNQDLAHAIALLELDRENGESREDDWSL